MATPNQLQDLLADPGSAAPNGLLHICRTPATTVRAVPLTGEQLQALGEQGAQRAKRWLESTCRAEVKWNNPTVGINKLQYPKAGAPHGSGLMGDSFSFDLGGNLLGAEVEGENFLAEVKKYANAQDQGTAYKDFLAKCYRVESLHAAWADHYLWITWAPFLVNSWSDLPTEGFVQQAVTGSQSSKYISLGEAPYNESIGAAVASKVLIVVLADRQEAALALHGHELIHVRQALLSYRSTA